MFDKTVVAKVTFYEPGSKTSSVLNEQGIVEELEMSASITIGEEPLYQYRLFQKHFNGELKHAILKIYPDLTLEWVSYEEEVDFVNDILTKAVIENIALTTSKTPLN